MPAKAGQPDAIAEFDVARGGDAIVVPVSSGGTTYRFLLDTGCTGSFFHNRHRHLLGKPTSVVPGRFPGGSRSVERFAAPRMKLGAIPLQSDAEVACLDLSNEESASDSVFDGILGMDALRHFILNINFDEGKVRILKSANNVEGRALPIIWHHRKHMREGPFILAHIDGDLPCEFLVDTGSVRQNYACIDTEPFDFLESQRIIVPVGRSYVSSFLGKTVRTRFGRLSTISIAGYRHDDMVIERLPFWNTLGIGFLSRYIVTFDFPSGVLYLKPGNQFGRIDSFNQSGLHITRARGKFSVRRVTEGGPGHLAGIKAGDVILSIDGIPVRGFSPYQLSCRFMVPGTHTVIARRGHEDIQTSLSLPGQLRQR